MKKIMKTLVVLMGILGTPAFAEVIELYKSPTCGCCSAWAKIMAQRGYEVNVHHKADWTSIKEQHAMPAKLQSCHTAVIGGYLIEGHVPEADIARLLVEKPDNIAGLAAPGMPHFSPGMAKPTEEYKDFAVIAFDKGGNTSVYHQY